MATQQPAAPTPTTLMANTTTTTTTTVITSTTTVTTTTVSFSDLPGTLFDMHQMCVADWDEVYDGKGLAPREYTTWNALHIARVSLCAWIIMSHVALIIFIFGKGALRVNPKNPLIANLAVANILLAVFVVPVKQHLILNPDTVNCGLDMGWVFITDYYQPAVSLFAVLSLVFERFIYVYTQKNQKKVLRAALIIGTLLLILTPWIISLIILLPTYIAAFTAESTQPNTCTFKVDEDYFLAAQVLSFIVPSIGVFVLAPYTGLLDCLRPSHCVYEYLTPKGESMAVTALISLVSIFSEAPYCVVKILMMRMECNSPHCARLTQALNVAMWIRICKAAIFPFIWLFYTDIRKAILCCLPDTRHYDNDDDDDDDDDKNVMSGAGVPMLEHSRDREPKDDDVCVKEMYPAVPSTSAAVEPEVHEEK